MRSISVYHHSLHHLVQDIISIVEIETKGAVHLLLFFLFWKSLHSVLYTHDGYNYAKVKTMFVCSSSIY